MAAKALTLAAVLALSSVCDASPFATRGRKVLQNIDGAVCGLGSIWDVNRRECRPCAVGTYQDEPDFATQCKACNGDQTTCCPGSVSSGQCIPRARRGSLCPAGSPATCPPGSGQNGARSPAENYACPLGYYKPLITDPYTGQPNVPAPYCTQCPKDTFSAAPGAVGQCTPCPLNTATCCLGTTSRSDCKRENRAPGVCPPFASCQRVQPLCPPGMAWDELERTCHPCGFGTYNDDPTATDCKECNLPGYTTCCEGSRYSSECVPVADKIAGLVCNYTCPFLYGPFRK